MPCNMGIERSQGDKLRYLQHAYHQAIYEPKETKPQANRPQAFSIHLESHRHLVNLFLQSWSKLVHLHLPGLSRAVPVQCPCSACAVARFWRAVVEQCSGSAAQRQRQGATRSACAGFAQVDVYAVQRRGSAVLEQVLPGSDAQE